MILSVPSMIWKFAAEFATTRDEVTTTTQENPIQSSASSSRQAS